jgi:hypothetical protein
MGDHWQEPFATKPLDLSANLESMKIGSRISLEAVRQLNDDPHLFVLAFSRLDCVSFE